VTDPEQGSVERWAWDYILTTSLAHKLAPPPPPDAWQSSAVARRLSAPGRPPELRVVVKAKKTRGLSAPLGRARALHTFVHHELQAAELMMWALLAFPEAPLEYKEGLVRIALDETRHMRMFEKEIIRLGHIIGDFPVRDWFWERVVACRDPASFVAVMGLGLESANLEHAATFAQKFREAGDEESARVQEIVGLEEIAHVRFGVKWFTELTGGLDFATWSKALPAPLSPLLMRGRPLQRQARLRAGQPAHFIDELEQWQSPDMPGY